MSIFKSEPVRPQNLAPLRYYSKYYNMITMPETMKAAPVVVL